MVSSDNRVGNVVNSNYSQALKFDLKNACDEIESSISNTLTSLQRDGAVIALSGGLDSAVAAALTVRALGKDRVHLLNLPERDSKPLHQKHASQLAEHLGIKLTIKRISPILRASGTYNLLPLRFIPSLRLRANVVAFTKSQILPNHNNNLLARRLQPKSNSWLSRGNAYAIAKHRIRVAVVYQYAEVYNLLVVGAANRTEWMTGTFCKWGVDHCADIMPLLHLYRSQLEELPDVVNIPDFIRYKAADPDLIPGINDKGNLLGKFADVDQILYCIENEIDVDEIRQTYGNALVDRILQLVSLSTHMRESPYRVHVQQ